MFWQTTELKKVANRFQMMAYKNMFLRYKFKYFIQSNNLYTLEKKIPGKDYRDIEESVRVKWRFEKDSVGEKILVVRLLRDGSKLEDGFRDKGKNLQALIKKELIRQEHNAVKGYSEYRFKFTDTEEYFYLDKEIEKEHKGYITLNKYFDWDYIRTPHLLLNSVSGGGKTYFLLSLVKKMMAETDNENIYICDGKFDELEEIARNDFGLKNVASSVDDIVRYIHNVNERMEEAYLKKMKMDPVFLVIDEFAALQLRLNKKEVEELISCLKNIILKGRRAGYIVVLALQRANREVIDLSIRDNCALKIGFGNMSEENYKMTFGEMKNIEELVRFEDTDKGKGYISFNGSEITRFNAPVIVRASKGTE